MPFVKVMIHAVWGTKGRDPFLSNAIRSRVIDHIQQNSLEKGIHIDILNGHVDHLHCLFGLNASMSVSKAMQLLKGESAYWINGSNLVKQKFEWADEYFAVSVSESMLDKVRAYIENQAEHHRRITFVQDYQSFIDTYKPDLLGYSPMTTSLFSLRHKWRGYQCLGCPCPKNAVPEAGPSRHLNLISGTPFIQGLVRSYYTSMGCI